MTLQSVERALVSDRGRAHLLVVAGTPPSLPTWTLEDGEPADSFREARTRFGIVSPFLRTVRLEGDPLPDRQITQLLEFEPPEPRWEPPVGLAWLPFVEVEAGRLDLGPDEPAIRAWIAGLRADVPAARPPWARPGWHATTSEWLRTTLARDGLELVGRVEQLGSWPISSLLAAETTGGRVILKTVPPAFAHEPALTCALADEHRGAVPSVVATDEDRRHLLMNAFAGAPLGREPARQWADGLVELAAIQQSWIGRQDAAARIGVEDRSLAVLDSEVESIVTDVEASPGLNPEARARLMTHVPLAREIIGRLRDGPVPETLVHGDFHPWNVQRDAGRLVIYDWSDACWTHPFLDVGTFAVRTDDVAARAAMESAYLAAWSGFADAATLRKLLAWSRPVSELQLSASWRRLRAIFEPDGAFPFVDRGVQRHLEFALAAMDELVEWDLDP